MNKPKLLRHPLFPSTFFQLALISALFTASISLIVFACLGIAPFGSRALIFNDGEYQLTDLYCWFKDVLQGKSSIDYTFTKSLGGSNFAVFAYYLSSPLSLLVIFFSKSSIPLFMNFIFLIKSALAAAFASYYLLRRFRPTAKIQYGMTVLLSVSYALSPFMFAQSGNTMWLDGVYMLPLLLIGCEKIVSGEKSIHFSICVALAIVFNWYTGIIDLIFACFWLLFEIARKFIREQSLQEQHASESSQDITNNTFKSIFNILVRYALSCICAILISAILLLPTLIMLSGRTYGHSDKAFFLDFGMIGNITDVLSNYSFGMVSLKGSVSLFAGSFVLIGLILFFLIGKKCLKEKLLNGGLLLFTVLMFFWHPLVVVFSMFRKVQSFWYRYSYLGCFVLVVLAAEFYLTSDLFTHSPNQSSDSAPAPIPVHWMPLLVAILFSIITIFLSFIHPNSSNDLIYGLCFNNIMKFEGDFTQTARIAKVIFPLLTGLLLSFWLYFQTHESKAKLVVAGIICTSLICEFALGQIILSYFYVTDRQIELKNYYEQQTTLLRELDLSTSERITQTSLHSDSEGFPISYNEPMAYGYRSLTSFVSAPDERSIRFLDKCGYRQSDYTLNSTVEENLAIDSLLNVKYILLDADDPHTTGLSYIAGIDGFKKAYLNPYCAPAAFVYSGTGDYDSSSSHSYQYLNEIYRKLSGIDCDIYSPVSFINTQEGYSFRYDADLNGIFNPDTQILYADFNTNTTQGANLYIDGEEYCIFSTEWSPKMLRLLPVNQHISVEIVFNESDTDIIPEVTDVHFYVLDLPTLKLAVDNMKANACTQYNIKDGRCSFEISAHNGESLFTTIPNEKGWTITRNGERITADTFGDALISIPLEDGMNKIEMEYHLPFRTESIVLTIMGILMLIGTTWAENRSSHKKAVNNGRVS